MNEYLTNRKTRSSIHGRIFSPKFSNKIQIKERKSRKGFKKTLITLRDKEIDNNCLNIPQVEIENKDFEKVTVSLITQIKFQENGNKSPGINKDNKKRTEESDEEFPENDEIINGVMFNL